MLNSQQLSLMYFEEPACSVSLELLYVDAHMHVSCCPQQSAIQHHTVWWLSIKKKQASAFNLILRIAKEEPFSGGKTKS